MSAVTEPRQHGTLNAYTHGGCRCDECKAASAAHARAYRAANGEREKAYERAYYSANRERVRARDRAYNDANRERVNAQANARRRAYQAETADRATRRGQQWTGPELEHALRLSEDGTRWAVTARQAALDLGRTRAAVMSLRDRARRLDPTPTMIAGLPDATKEVES